MYTFCFSVSVQQFFLKEINFRRQNGVSGSVMTLAFE